MGWGAKANLILMLIFVYFIIISFFLPGWVQGVRWAGVGFDLATGEVCVLDPRERKILQGGREGRVGVGLTNKR